MGIISVSCAEVIVKRNCTMASRLEGTNKTQPSYALNACGFLRATGRNFLSQIMALRGGLFVKIWTRKMEPSLMRSTISETKTHLLPWVLLSYKDTAKK